MKEQDKVKSKLATETTPRPALNPPHLGSDEFKSLGQASSELIAKLTNRAKAGAISGENTQPPSKMMQGENIIYLNSKGMKKRPPNRQNDKASDDDENHNSCRLFYIFQ
ncbi:MAG: hypothetical protein HRT61_06845 [Ekhidna sp.]|nr:hypothetical protein [Ekhidna sp.]